MDLRQAWWQVDLYENGTIAIVEAVSPELGNRIQRVRVQLPGTSQELMQKFREKKVNFAAHSQTEDGGAVFLNLLGTFRAADLVALLIILQIAAKGRVKFGFVSAELLLVLQQDLCQFRSSHGNIFATDDIRCC